MLNLLEDFRRPTNLLSPATRAMLEDPDFDRVLKSADSDMRIKADLTIKILELIALDPSFGDTPDKFYRIEGDTITFFVCFRLLSNFIGGLKLSATDEKSIELKAALAKNLNSRMFEAAKLARNLDASCMPEYEQAKVKAKDAYLETLLKFEYSHEYPVTRTINAKNQVTLKAASTARSHIFDHEAAPVDARKEKAKREAAPGFANGWTEGLVIFLYTALLPNKIAETEK